MKILGLGPASIKKLDFTDISDIYISEKSYFIERLGTALGEKLYTNIQQSKDASLNKIIASMGIPLVGKTAADKICSKVSNIYEITEDLVRETLGPKSADNFITWLNSDSWVNLPFQFISEKPVEGKSVCISGKLKSFKTKAQAASYLKDKGYVVTSSVTKNTDILVNESGLESEKTKKARANGTQIITNIMELE
jgi:NAD-dependent DNA ligase